MSEMPAELFLQTTDDEQTATDVPVIIIISRNYDWHDE